MTHNGRVEIDFDYMPDGHLAREHLAYDGGAYGLIIELAAHAAHTAAKGHGLRHLRFGSPPALCERQLFRAAVDRASQRVEVTSRALDGPPNHPVALLSADVAPLVREPHRLFDLAERLEPPPRSDSKQIFAHAFERELLSVTEQAAASPCRFGRARLRPNGIIAEIELAETGVDGYRIHPGVIAGWWVLVRAWMRTRGVFEPLVLERADEIYAAQPGARVTQLRLVQASDGDGSRLHLVAEAEHGIANSIAGLDLRRQSLIAASPSVPSGSLAAMPKSLPARERRRWCERRLIALIGDVLSPGEELPLHVPFRDLGMTSVQATSLAARISADLDRGMPAMLLFDHPTLARLVDAVLTETGEAKVATRSRPYYHPSSADREEAIAVVGMGCRLPGGICDPDSYWTALRDGIDAVAPISSTRADLVPGLRNARWPMAALDGIENFDPRFFGISDTEAAAMDPQHRLLLETTWEALEHAGIVPSTLADTRTGVFLGTSAYAYAMLVRDIDAYSAIGNEPSAAAGRISYFFGFRGPSVCVDTACSTSLVTICMGSDSLRRGESDLAIAGGCNLLLDGRVTEALMAASVLSESGHCRAFDRAADGYVRGEGCGVVLLRRLSDAERLGEPIIAVIRGYAVGHGGRTNGLTAPSRTAQADLMQAAVARSAVAAHEVGYVEAHGSATPLGDAIELQALGETYGSAPGRREKLSVGSVKTNIGHLEIAAGVAGFMKAALCVERGEVPRNLHFTEASNEVDWETCGLAVATAHGRWPPGATRIAAVNSFGMSGTYAHVILQQPPPTRPIARAPATGPLLAPVSARNARSARRLASAYAEYLRSGCDPRDLAFTAALHRQPMPVRAAAVAATTEQLIARLDELAAGAAAFRVADADLRSIAFVYAGHGSQVPRMGEALYRREPVFRAALDRCDELSTRVVGCRLTTVLYGSNTDARALDRPELAHPAIFALQYALTSLWRSWGVVPDCVLGHSLGEFAAAVAAGVMDLEDAFRLVAERALLMQSVHVPGAMAALKAPCTTVRELLSGRSDVVIAAFNSPEQIVISGAATAVDEACADAAALGIRTHRVPISQAAHSHLMDPVLGELEAVASTVRFKTPTIPFVSTVTGRIEREIICTPRYWRDQLRSPVLFFDAIRSASAFGARVVLEIAAHPVLMAAAGGHLDDGQRWVPSLRRSVDDLEQVLTAVGELFVAGHSPLWDDIPPIRDGQRVRAPTYPFDRQRYWLTATATRDAGDDAFGGASPGRIEETRAEPAERSAMLGARIRLEILQVLGAEHERIALDDDLGDLGLDSLAIIQLQSRFETLFRQSVPEHAFAEHPSIRAMTTYLLERLGLSPAELTDGVGAARTAKRND